jgi:glutamate/tyrosine decarboxylase-like PLP-dependent enzyme
MPERSIPREAAYQIISDELMLDGNPRLNLASFVTTWMEPECDKLIMGSINKNYVDMDEYPVTTELQVLLVSTTRSHRLYSSLPNLEILESLQSLKKLLLCSC